MQRKFLLTTASVWVSNMWVRKQHGPAADTRGGNEERWHWYTSGESAADILALTNNDIVNIDLNDAPSGVTVEQQVDSKRELPSATGVIDIKTFLSALRKIGFDGPIRAEPFNAELRKLPKEQALAATIASLRKAFAA